MPESMTGFGSAYIKEEDFSIRMEVRSLNSKGLDISIKGSREVTPSIEREFRHLISKFFQRGYFLIHVDVVFLKPFPFYDIEGIKGCIERYRKIFDKIGLAPSDDRLLKLVLDTAIFVPKEDKKLTRAILYAFKDTLKGLKRERMIEGKTLVKEIRQRLKALERLLGTISKRKPILIKDMKINISERIRELAGEDTERAWMEASILADKSDIREEAVRFRSHIQRFKEIIKNKGPIGKKLDFLCQEMQREANTMASKLPALSEVIVDVKSEIEKIRQQLHNLE